MLPIKSDELIDLLRFLKKQGTAFELHGIPRDQDPSAKGGSQI